MGWLFAVQPYKSKGTAAEAFPQRYFCFWSSPMIFYKNDRCFPKYAEGCEERKKHLGVIRSSQPSTFLFHGYRSEAAL